MCSGQYDICQWNDTTTGVNNDSPLNEYSISELMHEKIRARLYELVDGIHTTMDNGNPSDILAVDGKEKIFAGVNGDSK